MVASADGIHKTCVRCGDYKPLTSYHKDRTSKDKHEHRCKPCKFEYNKQRVASKPEEITTKRRQYYDKHGDRERANHKKWNAANHDHVIKYASDYTLNKLRTDPIFKLKHRLRSVINRQGLRRGKLDKFTSTEKLLGCSYTHFMEHLVNTALHNYGFYLYDTKYDLDHIVPACLATTEEDVRILNKYTNFQLLYPEHNRAKSNLIGWDIREINQ